MVTAEAVLQAQTSETQMYMQGSTPTKQGMLTFENVSRQCIN